MYVLAPWLPPSPKYISAVLYVVFWMPNRHPEFLVYPSKNLRFGSKKSCPNSCCVKWKRFVLTAIPLPSSFVLGVCHCWFSMSFLPGTAPPGSQCKGPMWAGAKHNEGYVNRWTRLPSTDHAEVWVLRAGLTGGNGPMSVCAVVRGTYHC